MIVTRKNNKPNPYGPNQNGVQKENKAMAQKASKDNSNPTQKEKGGPGKGPIAQQMKTNARPNATKPRNSVSAAQKRKGMPSQVEYKFDFNPLLKQPTQAQTNIQAHKWHSY